jgi:hypothetical protein
VERLIQTVASNQKHRDGQKSHQSGIGVANDVLYRKVQSNSEHHSNEKRSEGNKWVTNFHMWAMSEGERWMLPLRYFLPQAHKVTMGNLANFFDKR